MILSTLKSLILSGIDAFNNLVGGPTKFTRLVVIDPTVEFPDDQRRRDFIAANAEVELKDFVNDGFYSMSKPSGLGDDAIWQGIYTATTVLRWKLTPTEENHARMLSAVLALKQHFHKGILCRGAIPAEFEYQLLSRDPSKIYHDENGYIYLEDASLDSLLGVMFGAAVVNKYADEQCKAALSWTLKEFSFAFSNANYSLVNRDNTCTPYGDCSLGFFQAPIRLLAATLPSIVSGGIEWEEIARKYGAEFAVTDTQIPGKISYVNAHLAMLATLTFVMSALQGSPGLPQAIAGLKTLMDKYADTGNSFLIFGCAVLGVKPSQSQMDKARKVMSEFPIGLKPRVGLNNAGPMLQPVPVWQRPASDYVFQRSPYTCHNTDTTIYSRLDYLLAHYLSKV